MTIAFWRAITLRLAVNRNFCRRSLSLLFVLALPLTACLPPAFTTENILAVKAGMRSEEIREMFGRPQSVSSTMCGLMLENPGSAPRGNMAISLKVICKFHIYKEAPWSLIITTSTDSAALAVKDRVSVPGQMRKRLRSARPIRKMK